MSDSDTSRAQLIEELRALRARAARLERAEQELRAERDRAQRYLDVAGVMLVVISADETVGLVNRRGCELLGAPADGIVGKNWFDLAVPARMREEVRAVFRKLMAGEIKPVEYFENPILTRGGAERIMLWHNTVLRDEAGRILSTLSSGEDITQRKRAEEALRAANQLKTDFIRIASHELRTPVGYILGMARLMRDSRDAGRLLQAVQTMGAKAERLSEIIQAMFKLMPLQLRAAKMHYADVAPGELLEAVRLDCLPFVERRGQRLVIDSAEDLPTIRADRAKLVDVIENLLMNAIKFTPDGGEITLRAAREGLDRVCFTVADQGPGIPQRELPHIFDAFYSGGEIFHHSTGKAAYGKRGMGLGLAIVKHFVEMHGGSVGVSTGSAGSTFTVAIPLKPPPAS